MARMSFLGSLKIRWMLAWPAGEINRCRIIEGVVARQFAASGLQRFLRDTESWVKKLEAEA